jgi:hypothetical protein
MRHVEHDQVQSAYGIELIYCGGHNVVASLGKPALCELPHEGVALDDGNADSAAQVSSRCRQVSPQGLSAGVLNDWSGTRSLP